MEIISNKDKAQEICKKHIFDSNHFDCCMEMAQWKEQQMIDNLREVLSAHMHGGEIDEVLAELDEEMKGE